MKPLTRYIISTFGGKAVKREQIEKACERFDANPDNTINFMISYGYFTRVLRGLYYVKTLDEFRFKKPRNIYETLSLAMETLKVEWYFGLYTALRLNGLTHEYFDVIFILNNKIYRPKEINVGGEEVRFVKLKSQLFGFGTINDNGLCYSDIEKTLLDLIYINKYRSVPEARIVSTIKDYSKNVNKEKTRSYVEFYPKTIEVVSKNAGII